jgi:tetratricopeptide (TPR) repeat protein
MAASITEAFILAQQYQQAGSLLQAVDLYRQILQADPANAPVLGNLAEAYEALRDLPEAVNCYRNLARLEPDRPDVHSRLGVALHQQGNLPEATAAYEESLRLYPGDPHIHSNLGVALALQGQLEKALECYRRALRLRPDFASAHNNLGLALRANGKLTEAVACYQRAFQIRPDYPEAYNNLGITLRDQRDFNGAVAALSHALRLRPNYVEALSNLGLALRDQGRLEEAAACQRRAIELRPDGVDIYLNLGNVLHDLGDIDGASAAFQNALRLQPDCVDAHNSIALILEEQGRPEQAVGYVLEGLRYAPNSACLLAILGELAANDVCALTDEQLRRIESLAGAPATSTSDASMLHFSLAMMSEKRGAYDEAFASYRQGNAMKHRLLHETQRAFDPGQHGQWIDQLIAAFSPEFFDRVRGFGLDSETPVFIVGMPRSGTTLVEQILSRHPSVFGAGELRDLPRLVSDLPGRLRATEDYPRCIDRLDRPTVQAAADEYLRKLAAHAGSSATGPSARITDKAPLNCFHLGLIAAIFPRARVIHCRRDPRDVCLSCYFQYFHELTFTWDLGDLGFFYREYERLMEHWRRVLPLQPLDVDYEQLVTQPESMIRRLLDYCGLEWDDRCLRSHESRRPVLTGSKYQVRRPIYTTSVARWRHYEAHLGPLLDALGPIGMSSDLGAMPTPRGHVE